MKKLKVCFVTALFYPSIGGVETFVYEISKRLIKKGIIVEVHTSMSKNAQIYEEIDNIKIFRYNYLFKLFGSPINPSITLGVLKRRNFDIIHTISTFPLICDLSLFIGKILDKKTILTHQFDGNAFTLIGKIFEKVYCMMFSKIFINFADAIIATTNSYNKNSPYINSKSCINEVIPNGVDIKKFSSCINGNNIRKKYSISKDYKVVLFVGRLVNYKGIDYLINSIPDVLNEYKKVVFMILGGGEQQNNLKKLTNKLNIEKKVIFTGKIPHLQVPYYYAASDIVILPSTSSPESFGIVLIEAGASGKATISTNIPGVKEIIIHGKTGLKIPPKNSKAITNAIIYLLKNDNVRNKMGSNARIMAENIYDWDKIANQYMKLYAKVLNK